MPRSPQIRDVTARYPIAANLDRLLEVRDDAIGLQAFIAIARGTAPHAAGGVRRWRYHAPDDAVADVVSLAEQMAVKTRFAGLDCGGAKAVICAHDDLPVTEEVAAGEHPVGILCPRAEGPLTRNPEVVITIGLRFSFGCVDATDDAFRM